MALFQRLVAQAILLVTLAAAVFAEFHLNWKVMDYYYAKNGNWLNHYTKNAYKLNATNLDSKETFVYSGDRNTEGLYEFTARDRYQPGESCMGTTITLKNSPLEYFINGVIFIVEPFEYKEDTYRTATMILVFKSLGENERTVYLRIPLFKAEPSYEQSIVVVDCEPITLDQITTFRKQNPFFVNNSCLKKILERMVVRDRFKTFVQHLELGSDVTALRTLPVMMPKNTLTKLVRALEGLKRSIKKWKAETKKMRSVTPPDRTKKSVALPIRVKPLEPLNSEDEEGL